jgi:hypothetical protein
MTHNRQQRRDLARGLQTMLEHFPEHTCQAIEVLLGAMVPGRAAAILVVGGDETRVSMVLAGSDRVAETVKAFDSAFVDVPVMFDDREGANAKSTH